MICGHLVFFWCSGLAPIDGLVGTEKKTVVSWGKTSAQIDICLFLRKGSTLSNPLVHDVTTENVKSLAEVMKQLHLETSLFLRL